MAKQKRTEKSGNQPLFSQLESRPQRVLLGWERPGLAASVDWLAERFVSGGAFDLSGCLIVIPTARARRRLLQLLAQTSQSRSCPLVPPKITTVGEFPEELYVNARPFADEATRLLAWQRAIGSMTAADRRLFFSGEASREFGRDLAWARQLADLHTRLAMDVRSFRSVYEHLLALQAEGKEPPGDIQRWHVLAEIQAAYYEQLRQNGWWDLQAARSVAIHAGECRLNRNLLLVGAADLSQSNRRMLEQVADRTTSLVLAPAEHQAGFDEFGCLRPEYWFQVRLDLPDDRIRFVDRPADQGQAVLDALNDLQARFTADEISIGVPDDRLFPAIELALQGEQLRFRRLEGEPLTKSPPVRLLKILSAYLEFQDYPHWAQALRHPDLFAWLTRRVGSNDWLGAVDCYQSKYLPGRIALDVPLPLDPGDPECEVVGTLQSELARLLEPFWKSDRLAANGALGWQRILAQVYDGDTPETSSTVAEEGPRLVDRQLAAELSQALATIRLAWENRAATGPEPHPTSATQPADTLPVDKQPADKQPADKQPADTQPAAGDWLDWAIGLLAPTGPGDDPDPEAIELVGWLELPFDDAPVLIVTGINEEAIGSLDPVLPLLPPPLAESLGIAHSNQRLARNLLILANATKCRQTWTLISGRRDLEGNPNTISRLLLAVDDETLVRRVNAYFSFAGSETRRRWLPGPAPRPSRQQLKIPRPNPVAPVRRISVTRFRDFLKCPYRFYLSNLLELNTVRDDLREMDGAAFGGLAHDVLERFGREPIRDSANESEIFEFLSSCLDEELARHHADAWLTAVKIQIESLRERLAVFARIQAAHRAAGWEIIAVEQRGVYDWQINGQTFQISGRLDRIDRGPGGQLAVWDYKTSDAGKTIEQAHRDRQGNWLDLQLPLYRYLIQSAVAVPESEKDRIQLGYILLPRSIREIQFDRACWTVDELRQADQRVTAVLQQIEAQQFWPPAPVPPEFSEDFAGICQDSIFEKECGA